MLPISRIHALDNTSIPYSIRSQVPLYNLYRCFLGFLARVSQHFATLRRASPIYGLIRVSAHISSPTASRYGDFTIRSFSFYVVVQASSVNLTVNDTRTSLSFLTSNLLTIVLMYTCRLPSLFSQTFCSPL